MYYFSFKDFIYINDYIQLFIITTEIKLWECNATYAGCVNSLIVISNGVFLYGMLNDIPEFSRLLAVEQFCWKGNFKMAYQVKFHNSFHWDGILRTNIVRNRLRWKSCIRLVWINPMRISLVFVSLRKYSRCYCCENCIWWKQNSSIWLLLIFGFKCF